MPSRILGALKVSAVLILDLSLFLSLFHSPAVAAAGVIGIGIYTFLGGYFALVQEGGVRLDKLPRADRLRLETALRRLTDDRAAHGDRARLRLYLIPGDRNSHVAAVQRRLTVLGYYTGQADGIYGRGTQAAVTRARKDLGLPALDAVDEAFYRAIGLILFE